MDDLGLPPIFGNIHICWNEFGVPVGFPVALNKNMSPPKHPEAPGIVVTKYPHPHPGGDGGGRYKVHLIDLIETYPIPSMGLIYLPTFI